MNILNTIAEELNLDLPHLQATVALLDQGDTIPFIARYRKEITGSMEDVQIRDVATRLDYLRKLDARQQTVLNTIQEQGKLTPELQLKIENCLTLTALEDLYRPYKPKKQTRGQLAIKKGLKPLAQYMRTDLSGNLEKEALNYVSEEKGVKNSQDAIKGALDIIAEEIADNTNYRVFLKDLIHESGLVEAKLVKNPPKDLYNDYDKFSCLVKKIKPHQVLAINRGEVQKCLTKSINVDIEKVLRHLETFELPFKTPYVEMFKECIKDSYTRLIAPSVANDIFNELFEMAEDKSLITFKTNLRELLMQAPLKKQVVMGFDPGYTNGCKLAIVDDLGEVIYTGKVYPTTTKDPAKLAKDAQTIVNLVTKYKVTFIALGNGTASRESDVFLKKALVNIPSCQVVIVSEAGASIYSASKLGIKEFPDFDVALRSAVSIARRLIDPLSELVKIDPESIGVGQYQYDMNQKKLKEALTGVVEDSVNKVGVDVNYASSSLLSYVAGIGPSLGEEIVNYRATNGRFNKRQDLLKVNKFGKKAFENSAGFLRIKDGKEPLDASSIHPESYPLAREVLKKMNISSLKDAPSILEKLSIEDIEKLATSLNCGLETLQDIVKELIKPSLDPRSEVKKATLNANVTTIDDLKEGMILEGTVRNVMDFGCFVDVGLHDDGLVHISELADHFVKNISDEIHIGDIVKVRVIKIDKQRGRISLSIKQAK